MSTAPSPLPSFSGSSVEPAASDTAVSETPKHRYQWGQMIPFLVCHLVVLGLFWTGVTWQGVALGVGLWALRMVAVTGVYHRYFSHRTYKTSRPFQFVLAFLAETSAQRGVLWWAANHRAHHLYSDTERDQHSPKQHGFWHSHLMWIFEDDGETDWKRIKDFGMYPELIWLNKWHLVPPTALAVMCLAVGGWSGLLVGFFLSTVATWHCTDLINSLCHVWGKRRFETKDTSRNNFFLALLTFGEGWHNNHHHYMNSCRQGFYWWEIDPTYYVLRGLAAVGLIWDIKEPPARVLEEGRQLDAAAKA